MQENRFIELLAKKKSQEISLLELRELSTIIDNNPDFAAFAHTLDAAYETCFFQTENEEKESYLSMHWHRFKEKINTPVVHIADKKYSNNKSRFLRTTSIAASLIIVLGLAAYFYFPVEKNTVNNPQIISASTQKGSKSKIVLPDGTTVNLNADSKLSYETDFNLKERKVKLRGEAFFDVKPDASRPFIIHTNKADVRVLGTMLNVRNYPGENIFETVLIKGRVEVTPAAHPNKKVILKPLEKLVITNEPDVAVSTSLKKKNTASGIMLTHIMLQDSLIVETLWLQNQMSFINKPLVQIAADLERQYNIQIVFKSDKAKNYRYTVYLNNYDVADAIEALQRLKKFSYTLDKNILIIE